MIATPVLAWTLTAVFVVAGGYALLRLSATVAGALSARRRTTELAHLVMAVSMVVMTWTWFGAAGQAVQVVLFAVFTAYFAALAPLTARGSDRAAHACTGGAAHALMCAAMVWMIVSMPLVMAAPVSASGSGGGHAGHAGHGGGGADAATQAGSPSGWAIGVTLAVCVALLVASGYWAIRALRAGPAPAGRSDVPAAADAGAVRVADAATDSDAGTDPGTVGGAGTGTATVAASAATARQQATAHREAAARETAARPVGRGPRVALAERTDAGCHALTSLGMAGMLLAMVAGW